MSGPDSHDIAAGAIPRRLFFYNGGFLYQPRLRRILELAGHQLRLGLPGPRDGVVVWGHAPTSARGAAVAARRGVPLIRIEDAFLRSLRPGRLGEAPLGLLIDPFGSHYDSSAPSLAERILAGHQLDNSNLLARAHAGISRIQALHLSKYNDFDIAAPIPAPGYVLVIDQARDDAAIRHSGASAASFRQMLAAAQDEHPQARIVIKTHPETRLGLRPGHFGPDDAGGRITVLSDAVSPWALLAGAVAVYTVSSQMGFEAILAGHRPRVFGQPAYMGWGLTQDENPLPRRRRRLTKAQLFAGLMILAPVWYDPCRDRLCRFEDVLDQLEAETRAFREDRQGHVAVAMRLWKRGRIQAMFGRHKPVIFHDDPAKAQRLAQASGRTLLVWAGKEPAGWVGDCRRVEDGFLRSRGLGADLVPPLSLISDDLGIYYDPARDSRLERLIAAPLPPGGRERAERMLQRLLSSGLSKYNLPANPLPALPEGRRILVPGQVEDDASLRLGAGALCRNIDLLRAARAAHPTARLIYKPHPDVEAGLRPGMLPAEGLALADHIAHASDPVALILACDEVWTMTSLLGFEALLRGKPVTCLGMPFYAGWGLTRDLAPVPARRIAARQTARPDRIALLHATLIAYPRYYDPVSRRPCPPEVALDRLQDGPEGRGGWHLRILAKLQGYFAGQARFWR